MAPVSVSFHLLIEDQGLVSSAILVPLDSNWLTLCPWAMSFFQQLCPAPLPSVTASLSRGAIYFFRDFPGGSDGEESACNVGDPSLMPGSGKSFGERNGNPLQYSCLENPMDRGAW